MIAQRLDRPNQAEYGFLLFLGAAEFTDKSITFNQFLVTKIDRHEDDRPLRVLDIRIDRHGQHAAFRLQQPPGAAAPALDEVLHRVALAQHLLHIGIEYSCVEPITLETAPQEKRTTPTQDATDDRQVEIDARCDVREMQTLRIRYVSQQQIVDMTAVTGRIDNLFVLGDFVELLHMVNLDTIVDLAPQPSQQALQHANGRVGNIGSDFERIFFCLAPGHFLFAIVIAAFGQDCLPHRRRPQYVADQGAAMGQIRPDSRNPAFAEVRAQDARHLAISNLEFVALGTDRPHWQSMTEAQ